MSDDDSSFFQDFIDSIGPETDYANVSALFPRIARAATRADLEHRGFEFDDDGATSPLLRQLKEEWENGLREAFGLYDEAKKKAEREMAEVAAYWEAEIPSLFEDWLDLPDPAGFSGQLADLEVAKTNTAVVGQLGNEDEGAQVPNKDLAGDIEAVGTAGSKLQGRTAETFMTGYVAELDPHIATLNLGVRSLSVCAQAEANVMAGARSVVLDIANQATGAFRDSAPKSGGGAFVVLMVVVGAVAAVASAGIGTPAIAAAVAGVAASAGAAETLTGAFAETDEVPETKLAGDDPNAVRDKIRDALAELNDHIQAEELKIRSIASFFATSPDYVQLTPRVNNATDSSQVFSGRNLAMQRRAVSHITQFFLPNIAAHLRDAAAALNVDPGAWVRPGSVGLTSIGPHSTVDQARRAVEQGLVITSDQLLEAAATLWHAFLLIQSADESAQNDLAWLRKSIDPYSTVVGAGAAVGGTGDTPDPT